MVWLDDLLDPNTTEFKKRKAEVEEDVSLDFVQFICVLYLNNIKLIIDM